MSKQSLAAHPRPHHGYGANDEALRAGALKLLHSNGYTALRRLRCEVTEGVVIVHGVVPTYYLKQMVQTIIRRLDGIQGMMNLVEVREADSCSTLSNEEVASSEEVAPDQPTRVRH